MLLGTDRFYRKYWLMTSVPGILVEVPESLPPMVTQTGEEKSWDTFAVNPISAKKPQFKDFLKEPTPEETGNAKPEVQNGTQKAEIKPEVKPEIESESMEVDTEAEMKLEKLEKSKNWSFTPNLDGAAWWYYRIGCELADFKALRAFEFFLMSSFFCVYIG